MDPVGPSFAFQLDSEAMGVERAALRPLPSVAEQKIQSLTHQLNRPKRRAWERIHSDPVVQRDLVARLAWTPPAGALASCSQITCRRRKSSRREHTVADAGPRFNYGAPVEPPVLPPETGAPRSRRSPLSQTTTVWFGHLLCSSR